ncbi:MAG: DUF5121 domain-containing protein, partial [Bacteroidales bacterium]
IAENYVKVQRLIDGKAATLTADGHGAIYVLGEGMGKPSLAHQPGWEPGNGYAVAEIAPKTFQMTLTAGPKTPAVGQTIRADTINFKFYHQNAWGGEFGKDAFTTKSPLLQDPATTGGNLKLVENKALEVGKTYVFIMDLTKGVANAVLTLEKR